MPQNFPEVWQERVREKLSTAHVAPWLDGIEELDADIVEFGEENLIHIPIETFSPEVLVNNSTYPIDVEEYDDGTKSISLDKFQTLATKITDDAAIGASYSKIDQATKGHVRQINRTKYKKAIHALAPAEDTPSTPVVEMPEEYKAGDVYDHIVKLKDRLDKQEVPEDGRRLVLSTDHYNKLLLDRERFGDLLVDHKTGRVSKDIGGFKVYTYVSNPYYDEEGKKKAYGAVNASTDRVASVAFLEDNVGKKTGLTKQYYDKPDTKTQSHLVNYRHYFIALPIENKAIGAII